MEKVLEKKLSHIESLLIELHAKIDNFLGFETLTEDEILFSRKSAKAIRNLPHTRYLTD